MEKRGGWKTSRMTPLPTRGFGPPLVRYVFHPPQASVLFFSCTKIHDRADQKLFWRGPKIFGRARSLVRFPPPIRFAPPHVTAQLRFSLKAPENLKGAERERTLQKHPLLDNRFSAQRLLRSFGAQCPASRPYTDLPFLLFR